MDTIEGFEYANGRLLISRSEDENDLNFCLSVQVGEENRSFLAARAADESIEKTLVVLGKKLSQLLSRGGSGKRNKKKHNKKDKQFALDASVHPAPASLETPNDIFWQSGLQLKCSAPLSALSTETGSGEEEEAAGQPSSSLCFDVVLDAPRMVAIKPWPMKRLMLGYPIVPFVDSVHADGVHFAWLSQNPDTHAWEPCGEGKACLRLSIEEDRHMVGRQLRVVCSPWRWPRTVAEEGLVDAQGRLWGRSNDRILSGKLGAPEEQSALIELRKEYDAHTTGSDEVRVTTYNILADCYATMMKDNIYSYLEPRFLDAEYRSQVVLSELLASQSDIVCVQECERKVCQDFMEPYFILEAQSHPGGLPPYHAFYSAKGSTSEGLALLINPAKLRVLVVCTLSLKALIAADPTLQSLLAAHPESAVIMTEKLNQVGQVAVCSMVHNPSQQVLVGNTHLFYHPLGDYARLLQVYSLVNRLEAMRAELEADGLGQIASWASRKDLFPGDSLVGIVMGAEGLEDVAHVNSVSATIIFAGDLNSTPGGPIRGTDEDPNAVMEFMLDGQVTRDNEVWWTVDKFRWNRRRGEGVYYPTTGEHDAASEPECSNTGAPHLAHQMCVASAAGFPVCSNYSLPFKALLDYIFVEQDRVEVIRVAPTPSMERLGRDSAIPSSTFPSDHIPISVDLRLK